MIVGGGVSGLAAAWRLGKLRPDAEIRIFEASDRLGGVIRTSHLDGFLIEEGPDSFLTVKPQAVEFSRALGLEPEFLPTREGCRRSFILLGGRLLPVPTGVYLMAPTSMASLAASQLFTWRGKLRMAMEPLVRARRDVRDESLGSFVRRRLGQEALERLAQPMIAGIYSADPEALSLSATFPQFLEYERDSGSVIRGLARRGAGAAAASGPRYGLFLTLKNGLSDLPEAFARGFPAQNVRTGCAVRQIRRRDRGWMLALADGSACETEKLCLALPAWRSAELLADEAPALASLLAGIPYASTLTLHLAFAREAVAHPLDGMGFVVPAIEGKRLSACSFVSSKFAGRSPEGKILLRAFTGGAGAEPLRTLEDEEIFRVLFAELTAILGIRGEPLFWRLGRHARALPQYPVGHLETLDRIDRELENLPGLALAGNGYRGSGLPDCIAGGWSAAERLHV